MSCETSLPGGIIETSAKQSVNKLESVNIVLLILYPYVENYKNKKEMNLRKQICEENC